MNLSGRLAQIRLTGGLVWRELSWWVVDIYGRAQPTVGGTIPQKVVLRCISQKKADTRAKAREQSPSVFSSVFFASIPALTHLSDRL